MPVHDEEAVRAWAYDPESDLFDEQDSDLIIGLMSSDILVPLIADSSCPRSVEIQQYLDASLRRNVLRGEQHHLDKVRITAELASAYDTARMRDWSTLLSRRLVFREGVGRVDEKIALEMGETLLNDVNYSRPLVVSRSLFRDFVVRPESETGTIRERLLISAGSGRFKYSLHLSNGRRLY